MRQSWTVSHYWCVKDKEGLRVDVRAWQLLEKRHKKEENKIKSTNARRWMTLENKISHSKGLKSAYSCGTFYFRLNVKQNKKKKHYTLGKHWHFLQLGNV